MKNQYKFSLDFAESTVSSMTNTFEENVEAALEVATSVTLQNVTASLVYYMAVPAWYDRTNKRLYSALTGNDYWAVDGKNLTYTIVADT